MNLEPLAARRRDRGFTLIDLVIAMAIIAVLLKIAFPSYQAYIVRSSRQSAQGELVALANLQEKIFLNSSAYTSSAVGAYTGQSTGGLGLPVGSPATSGKSKDGRYNISATATATTFTLTATPKSGTPQAGDGNLTITESNVRTWGSKTW